MFNVDTVSAILKAVENISFKEGGNEAQKAVEKLYCSRYSLTLIR